jgi:predicted dehydrogenase
MMTKLQAAIIGLGFVGKTHAEALRRMGIPIRGVLERTKDLSEKAAERLGDIQAYSDMDELVADEDVSVVHICTPNYLHYPFAKAALLQGKHVVCEKPLAMNSQETLELVQLAESTGNVGAVSYNLRYYPLCQQAKAMIQGGKIGEPKLIHGSYLQDWLFYTSDWNWRLVPELGGSQRAIADIGTHWLDLAMWMTGRKVTRVFADISTALPIRKRPIHEVTTFASKIETNPSYEEVEIHTEDYASILLHFTGSTKGALTVSQVSAGRKNRLWIEIDGTEGSLSWNSETPNQLWLGKRDQPNEILIKDPALMDPSIRHYAGYPGGHAEGYPDTFVRLFNDVYEYISRDDFNAPQTFPNFHTGHEEVCLCEAIAESSDHTQWIEIMS